MKNNQPTDNQLTTIYSWIEWEMPREEARNAIRWLESHATRKEVSFEMRRLYPLHHEHKLSKEACFDSKIWEGYEWKNGGKI